MLEYTFTIRHDGCWTATVPERFPDVTATILYSYRLVGVSITMIAVSNLDRSAADDLVGWLADHEIMTDARLVSYDAERGTAYVSLEGDYDADDGTGTEPVLNVLLRHRCFPTVPATVSNGREHWSVLASSHEDASAAHEALLELGSVEVDALGPPDLDRLLTGLADVKAAVSDLTSRQREVLLRAIEAGYYDSPRTCTIEELAAMDDANVSTVGEHLRRAEAKVVESMAGLLAEPDGSSAG